LNFLPYFLKSSVVFATFRLFFFFLLLLPFCFFDRDVLFIAENVGLNAELHVFLSSVSLAGNVKKLKVAVLDMYISMRNLKQSKRELRQEKVDIVSLDIAKSLVPDNRQLSDDDRDSNDQDSGDHNAGE
jgi:hypothetical protein